MLLYYYDLETLPNIFTFTGKFENDPRIQTFEISSRRNDRDALLSWLSYLGNCKALMCGYNNLGFDYPVIHELLNQPYTFDATKASHLCQTIINQPFGRPQQTIRVTDRLLPQCDLMKINHFDNPNKRTSLKSVQFAMRLDSVEDLPFAIRDLTPPEMDQLIAYNVHDVIATEAFGTKCKHHIQIRQELLDNGVLTGDVLNYSDVKIGTEYLVRKIGRAKCYISGSQPKQTLRASVPFRDVILPKIYFRSEPYEAVLNWFKEQTIYPTGESRPALKANLAGLEFHFGAGGVHASVESQFFESSKTHVIKDIDVGGMYPAVAIANGFAPEHLGRDFTQAYRQMSADRKQYAKGSSMNLVLKLANNGAFGNSSNVFSCMYDPKFTFAITVNGQLQLIQLIEMLSLIPDLQVIQANTDGTTLIMPREWEAFFQMWCSEWEAMTGLKLEHTEYSRMWIRDVNNYVALGVDGKIKSKGAYWFPKCDADYWGGSGSNWGKDFSMMVVQKAIEEVLVNGHKPEEIVRLFTDPFDFMIRYKTPGSAKVFIGDRPQLKTVRYYVSTRGEPMKKVAAPTGKLGAFKKKNGVTNAEYDRITAEIGPDTWDARIHNQKRSKYVEVVTSIESGRLVRQCNKASDFNWADVDYDYYIGEVRKLMIGKVRND